MIVVNQFLEAALKNRDRVNEYVLGRDGTGGKCDCIGLAIGALRLAGVEYNGTHGSNWWARNYVTQLKKVSSASQLYVGGVVLKAHAPGESGWNLPERYSKDPDQNDYYHAGIVVSVNPLVIVHCTSVPGGIKIDTKIGKWNYITKPKTVDYEGVDVPVVMEDYVVTGGNLRMRKEPNGAIITTIKDGSHVTVIDKTNAEWYKVTYEGNAGYCKSEFLKKSEVGGTISLPRDVALTFYEALKVALNA